jgi:hypothetical protein
MRAPASGVSPWGLTHLQGCRERRQGRASRPPSLRVQAAKGSGGSSGSSSSNGKGGGNHHGGGTGGGVPPCAVGHSLSESATAPVGAAAAPQTAATDELLRMVDLLEKREQERVADHKNLLTLLKAVTAASPPPSDLQRLERCVLGLLPACAPA